MRLIKVAAGALNQTPLDWDGNGARILKAISQAKHGGAALLCLPEMCITGYGCEDAFFSPAVQKTALKELSRIAGETDGIVVSVGLPLMVRKAVFNTACLIANGEILGFTAKQHLAGEGIHYEHRWFRPWPDNVVERVRTDYGEFSVGDLSYEVGGIRIGFEICEDAWVARRPGADLAHRGVDIILNPSASHFAFGKRSIREQFVVEGSRAFSCHYVYANLLGNESGRAIYDGGTAIASTGRLVAAGDRLSFRDVLLTEAVIDIDRARSDQSTRGGYIPQVGFGADLETHTDFEWPAATGETEGHRIADWEMSQNLKEEEFARAVALGLFDYLRKSRSRGFVVSLSGGADSTATACLVKLAAEMALADLGADKFRKKLNYFDAIADAESIRAVMSELLVTAYQSTRNSSEATRQAARSVAEAVGSTHYELDVDTLVEGYKSVVGDAVGADWSWDAHDITLQNIQARTRGPSIWMIANLRAALLLATSNRSEAAVGYTTMDGDTCGGLSPIAGIDKAFLRDWLSWLETDGPMGFGSIPELKCVTNLAPTAELRPQAASQTDEGDLMPYDLLDAIERAAIRDKYAPAEVLRCVTTDFSDRFDDATLRKFVVRFFRLWCRNQWKRERYAPSFHLDDENLDPKTWCRFPILSGGFERELRDLDVPQE